MSIILAMYAWSFGHWYIGASVVTGALAAMAVSALRDRVGRFNRFFFRKLRFQWRCNRRYLLTGRY